MKASRGTDAYLPSLVWQRPPGIPVPVRMWEIVFLLVLCGAVAASCWPWMTTLGLENDEAHFLPAAVKITVGSPEKVPFPSGLYLFHRPFPLMTAAFIGAVDAYLYGLVFAVFGISVVVFRTTNLVLCLLLVVLAYWLARTLGNRMAAVVAAILLALDLEFLLHAPTNYGPIHVQMLCATLAVLLLSKWMQGGPRRHLIVAAFLLGLGFTEKLTFILFLGSLVVSLACFHGRAVLARLTFKTGVLAVLAFLLGCLPVLICTLGSPGIVLGFGRANTGAPAQWAAAVTQRYGQLQTLLAGQWSLAAMGGGSPGFGRFSAVWWGLLLACACVAAAAIAARAWPSLRRLVPPRACAFLAVLCVGVVGLSAFFPESGRVHHLMLIYPFVHCLVAIAFVWAGTQALDRRRVAGSAVVAFMVAALLATAVSTALNLGWFTRQVLRTGGRDHWSSAIFDLAAWVKSKPDTHFVFPSWGLYRSVFTLTGGKCSCRKHYFQLLSPELSPPVKEETLRLLKRRNSVWVFSKILPDHVVIKSRLFDLAREAGLQPRLIARFQHPQEGVRLYEAYSFEGPLSLTWGAAPLEGLRPFQVNMRDLSLRESPAGGPAGVVLQGTTDDTVNAHLFGVELPLTGPVQYFRFRAASPGWDRYSALTIQLLGERGEVLTSWERPFQWLPVISPEIMVEFGPDLFPDYFLYVEGQSGKLRTLRISCVARGRAMPVELAVSGFQFGQSP